MSKLLIVGCNIKHNLTSEYLVKQDPIDGEMIIGNIILKNFNRSNGIIEGCCFKEDKSLSNNVIQIEPMESK